MTMRIVVWSKQSKMRWIQMVFYHLGSKGYGRRGFARTKSQKLTCSAQWNSAKREGEEMLVSRAHRICFSFPAVRRKRAFTQLIWYAGLSKVSDSMVERVLT